MPNSLSRISSPYLVFSPAGWHPAWRLRNLNLHSSPTEVCLGRQQLTRGLLRSLLVLAGQPSIARLQRLQLRPIDPATADSPPPADQWTEPLGRWLTEGSRSFVADNWINRWIMAFSNNKTMQCKPLVVVVVLCSALGFFKSCSADTLSSRYAFQSCYISVTENSQL